MRRSKFFFLSIAICLFNYGTPAVGQESNEQKQWAYVGTFSSPLKDTLPTQVDLPPGNGLGIHIFEMNPTTGALKAAGHYRSGVSPSHVAINAEQTRLYSANETEHLQIDGKKQGSVSSFEMNPRDGSLKQINTVPSGGAGPTYVSIHPSGKFLLVANYFGGSVAVLPILEDGSLGEASDVKQDEGEIGPTVAKNAPSGSFAFSGHDHTHAHMIQADPSGKFVIHVDLGLDRIYIWKFDLEKGKLFRADMHEVALPPGDGPRHFFFHPGGKWFYSIQEEGSTVALFDWNEGTLVHRKTVSSLPPGYAGSNFCSEILVSHDGRFLYAGNRLHDSIGIFAIDQVNGELSFVTYEWTRGNYPRSFEFAPSGDFLYVCNQRADNIAIFAVDQQTGLLRFTEQYVPVGNPSCIVFGRKAGRLGK